MADTSPTFPLNAPAPGEALPTPSPCSETLTLLSRRRSTLAKDMGEPGPTQEQIDALLQIAARTPDHGKLFPWRFVVFQGEARSRFSIILEKIFRLHEGHAPQERYDLERTRFTRAPLVIGVISDVTENHKVNEWEQILSAGAVCQNILIAAQAMGFGAQWLTEWYAYDRDVKDILGLKSGERIAGFIYIGTQTDAAVERPRPAPRVQYWQG
ncbi:nitroreductase family protein [Woodsholea maritima]|uniref:nitroreductase family protein n=1 Tax=Woodsholea maritima TaxID=240237 RepID=UPI00036A1BD6|nr:nitroreductase [Woodsholea maritima]